MPGFKHQGGDLGSDHQVFDLAKVLVTQTALGIDQAQAGSAAQAIGAHGLRDRILLPGSVHAHGKIDAVFVQKGFQGHRRHRGMVFKDGMQTDHRDLFGWEHGLDALGLRQTVGDATRAQHLKGFQHHDLAAQGCKAQVLVGIEPALDLPVRSRSEVCGHARRPVSGGLDRNLVADAGHAVVGIDVNQGWLVLGHGGFVDHAIGADDD